MADESSAINEFLNGFGQPKEDPFKSADPFAEKETVDEVIEEAVEEEKALPFHKDPKVQKYIDRQVAKAIADTPTPPKERQTFKEEEINLPPSFVKLVGNDTDEKKQVLKDLSSYFGSLKGEARQEFLAEMQEQERAVQAQDQAALDELNAGFEEIEDSFGVDLSSGNANAQRIRGAFVEYLKKVSHKNADGEVDQFADIPAAWEEFQSKAQKPANNRAKTLASRSMGTQIVSDAPQVADRSWKGVEKLFSKLSN